MHTQLTSIATSAELERRGDALVRELFELKPRWLGGNISDYDSKFLAGLAEYSGAKRAVEIGVASGWSSAILLKALTAVAPTARVSGIDLSPSYYLDPAIATGQAVAEVTPSLQENYQLFTGRYSFDAMRDVGNVDFAFIDGHHMHPWATIDLLAILPFLSRDRWVAMHDLNLCKIERHRHTNRAPFYLFHFWPDRKIHSTQDPTMIGAVLVEREASHYLSDMLECLYTPWETKLQPAVVAGFVAFIGGHFGEEWARAFQLMCDAQNPN